MSVIRKKYAIPLLVVVIVLVIVKFYLLNAIAKALLVKAAEKTFKAKTEISSVRLSLLGGEITLNKVDIGDKDQPYFNLISFKKGHFKFNVRALLREHFHIEDASLDGIDFHTARKTSAALPPEKTGKIGAMMDKLMEKPLTQLKQEYSLASISQRLNLDEITDFSKLKTMDKVHIAQLYFQTLPDNLTTKYNNLQINQKVEQIKSDIETIQKFQPKKLDDYKVYVTKVQTIQKNVTDIQNNINTAKALVDQSYKDGQARITDIQVQANKDIATIKDKVALANYSRQHLFEEVLGSKYKFYLRQINRYNQLYQKVFPKKTTGLESWAMKFNVPGQDIHFPNRTREATFLVKNISVKGLLPGRKQTFKGVVKEITSDQNIRNVPTTLLIGTDDVHSAKKFQLTGLADFRAHRKLTKLDVSFSGAPLALSYWDPKSIPFVIDSGMYSINGGMMFNGDVFSTVFKVSAYKAAFSKDKAYDDKNIFHQLLLRIFTKYNDYFLSLKSQGLDFVVDSNIDDMIAAEINAYIQEQIDKVKADIQRQWDAKVAEYTQLVQAEYDKVRKQIEAQINAEIAKGQKQLEDLQSQLKTLQKEQESKLKDLQAQAQKELDAQKQKMQQQYAASKKTAEDQVASANAAARQKAELAKQLADEKIKAAEEKAKAAEEKAQQKADEKQKQLQEKAGNKAKDLVKGLWK